MAVIVPANPLPEIRAPFWRQRQRDTAVPALRAQWHCLEAAGTIDNFRIAAGRRRGRRRGFFYADSDAYKWADATARTLALVEDGELADLLAEFTSLVTAAQAADGYLFTYNQIHFPEQRWVNLQVEHELYCLGHLIEAGIAAASLERQRPLFDAALRAADLLVRDFATAGPDRTPGHPEVEIALIRLADVTGVATYRDLAARFVEERGRGRLFAVRFVREVLSQARRARMVAARQEETDRLGFDVQETLHPGEGLRLALRALPEFLSGRYQQQHAPVRTLRQPVGHAVRWGYLAAAATMLARAGDDAALLASLDAAWRRMVDARLYVTGGVGALPVIEGFGRDFELDNASAYCETCAAIASVLWSQEMLRAQGEARFADLVEWQLHNAVAVGVALDGRRYLYRNPLESVGEIERRPWFRTACCPSNVSRTWASLAGAVADDDRAGVRVQQLWSTAEFVVGPAAAPLRLRIDSDLPWHGRVAIEVEVAGEIDAALRVRIPSWSGAPTVRLDGRAAGVELPAGAARATASGYSPYGSYYAVFPGPWRGRRQIELELPMEVRVHRADARVRGNRGKVALSRGPVVYCLEGADHPDVPIPGAVLDLRAPLTLGAADDLDGCVTIESHTPDGRPLRFVPYFAWANRTRGGMQVWVDAERRA